MAESLGEQIRRVLQEAPFAMRQLAADAGLSYDVLRSWRSGRRRPSRSSALRLAAGLQRRGELLVRLAAELREHAEGGRRDAEVRHETEQAGGGAREAMGSGLRTDAGGMTVPRRSTPDAVAADRGGHGRDGFEEGPRH
jgi:transcriptional regulator with XRE-family HTH domain